MNYICFDKAAYEQANWSAMFRNLIMEEPEGCASLIGRLRNYSPEKLEALTTLWFEGRPMAIAIVAKELLIQQGYHVSRSYEDAVSGSQSSKWNRSSYIRVNWESMVARLHTEDPAAYKHIRKQLYGYSKIELEGFTTMWHNGMPTPVAVVAWDLLNRSERVINERAQYDAFYQRRAKDNSRFQTWENPIWKEASEEFCYGDDSAISTGTAYWRTRVPQRTPSYAHIRSQETGCWDADWMD